jgi:hypothetical protein
MQYAAAGPAAETVTTNFNFTVLPASYNDSVYIYRKPENLAEAIQIMRADILRQGGSFSGDEREGSFRLGEARGDYRVSGDRVELRMRSAAGEGAGRGVYEFSFDRPRNISTALRSLRTGIAEKGGAFDGDERAGSFKAGGISGRYTVAERVSVSILEKPFLIPVSLIEREVKNYFLDK